MTIEINWWMLSPLTAVVLTLLAIRESRKQGPNHDQDILVFLIMILTLIFSARFLP